jgi:hypothetical protein
MAKNSGATTLPTTKDVSFSGLKTTNLMTSLTTFEVQSAKATLVSSFHGMLLLRAPVIASLPEYALDSQYWFV